MGQQRAAKSSNALRKAGGGLLALGLSALMVVSGATAAYAEGPAVLSLEITAVDPVTGDPISTTSFGQHTNRIAYRIGYSCSVAECTNAVVTLPAIETDPTYNQFRMHYYQTWTPPAGGGASISHNVATGITVNLGNVAAGTSSTFLVQYERAIDASAPGIAAPAYFPPGYQIQRSATISSSNATGSVTANAAPVTWQIALPNPTVVKTAPATVSPDTNVTYTLAMSDGCFVNRGSNRWTAAGNLLCAESYTVVDRLPSQAVFVSAVDGGVYDPIEHTVTWTHSGATAAGGWGVASFGAWARNAQYYNRTVTVQYPASAFPESAGGADFVAPVTNNIDVSATYLDDAETTRTATNTFTHSVVRAEPFGRADMGKVSTFDQIVGGQRFVNVPPDTTGLICPSSGRDDWNRVCTPGQPVAPFATSVGNYWAVDIFNRGNVAGVATITDTTLADSALRVRAVTTTATTPAPTIAWTITNGTTTTSGTTTGTSYAAPAGSWVTAATVTSGSLAGPNLLQSGTAGTPFRVSFFYDVPVGTPLVSWTNTATATMAYPSHPDITPIDVEASGTVTFRNLPTVTVPLPPPTFNAGFVGAPQVVGGGQVVPGGQVIFNVRGATSNIPADHSVSPQYIFIAPAGWTIVPNSASFPTGSVPAGVAYTYKTATIAGVERHVVIASWPSGATFGSNVLWPTMSVTATPTFAVTAGTNSVASFWAGESRNLFDPDATTWGGKVVDTNDIDGDGNTTEAFATVNSTAVAVSGTARLDVVKEICVDAGAGCEWVSNPDIVVGVAPSASEISYRVTLVNAGNTTLSSVVGYDVLPYIGDPRGSTFSTVLNSVSSQSANLELTFSASQNPCRPEVLPSNPGCTDDWSGTAAEAQSIRAAVTGSLAPGATASFTFTADVVPGAPADAVACNSVAIDSGSTLPSEALPVCATTQEADLSIEVPARLPLQAGRPGVVPFTITNLGGSVSAPATVTIDVPAGIRITSLTPEGWLCVASSTEPDGSATGPVVVTCRAVDTAGTVRALTLDVPETLELPAVIPSDALVGVDTCFPAVVSGLMFDPVTENNSASACFSVVSGDELLDIVKDDGVEEVSMGDTITYTLTVSNLLVGESLSSVVVTDVLPDYLEFVSASGGGQVTGQGEADSSGALPGGTITWTIPALESTGVPTVGGDDSEGAVNSSIELTLTVRVLQSAETLDEIVNSALVEAADPASPDDTMSASDSDVDALIRTATLQLVKSVSPTTVTAVGDTVTYSFLLTNAGDVTLTSSQISEEAFSGSGDAPEITCPEESEVLAPGDSVTCTASYQVTQADLDAGTVLNTASATATAPSGLDAPQSGDSSAIVTVESNAGLEIVKSVVPTTITEAGESVEYSFMVTNTGNVTLSSVSIDEIEFTGAGTLPVVVCPPAAASLAPGDDVTCTASYQVTQSDVNAGTVVNTATATAQAPGLLDDPVSPPSTAIVSLPAGAGLAVQKSVSEAPITSAGQTITYLFEVENTGNVTLTNIAIVEREFTGSGDDVVAECPSTTLAPSTAMTCVGTYTVLQADVDRGTIDNTAAVTGRAPNGALVTSEDSSVDVIIEPNAAATVVKSASPGTLIVDQEVTYSFVVTNTGNVTLSAVEIDEVAFTGTGVLSAPVCASGAASLAPGAQVICSASYTITQDDVDAGIVSNTATALADSPAGAITSPPSSVELPFDQAPGLTLVKSTDVESYDAVDDVIEYRFRITNSGNVTLSEAAVVEQSFSGSGELSAIECAEGPLLPGEFRNCTATYLVTQEDVDAGRLDNVAHATASAPGADDVTRSDESSATVAFTGTVALGLTKTGEGIDLTGDGVISIGDSIRWSFIVSNLGVTTLTDVAVSDPTAGEVTCEATILPPGASVTCSVADYRVTSTDVAAGRVVNVASASALGLGNVVVQSAEAQAEVDVVAAALSMTGAASMTAYLAAGFGALALGLLLFIVARTRRAGAAG